MPTCDINSCLCKKKKNLMDGVFKILGRRNLSNDLLVASMAWIGQLHHPSFDLAFDMQTSEQSHRFSFTQTLSSELSYPRVAVVLTVGDSFVLSTFIRQGFPHLTVRALSCLQGRKDSCPAPPRSYHTNAKSAGRTLCLFYSLGHRTLTFYEPLDQGPLLHKTGVQPSLAGKHDFDYRAWCRHWGKR